MPLASDTTMADTFATNEPDGKTWMGLPTPMLQATFFSSGQNWPGWISSHSVCGRVLRFLITNGWSKNGIKMCNEMLIKKRFCLANRSISNLLLSLKENPVAVISSVISCLPTCKHAGLANLVNSIFRINLIKARLLVLWLRVLL